MWRIGVGKRLTERITGVLRRSCAPPDGWRPVGSVAQITANVAVIFQRCWRATNQQQRKIRCRTRTTRLEADDLQINDDF
jgi:hypothetical protein